VSSRKRSQRRPYGRQHGAQLRHHLHIGKANNANAMPPHKLASTSRIASLAAHVEVTIDLNDQPPRRRIKVDNERMQHRLPPKAAPKLPAAQSRPEDALTRCRMHAH
jgi:hypothetical protein